MDTFISVGLYIFGGFMFLLALIMVVGLSVDFYLSMRDGIGTVSVNGDKSVWVKKFLKEENGCIEVIDIFDNKVKICGVYSVKKF